MFIMKQFLPLIYKNLYEQKNLLKPQKITCLCMYIFLATLSFINGERSHTAVNRKPPTGRGKQNLCIFTKTKKCNKTLIPPPTHCCKAS